MYISVFISLFNCLSLYLSVYSTVYLWLYSPYRPWPLFHFLNLYTVGGIPWTGDQPVARPLPTRRTTQTQNKCTQASMPIVGLELTIPAFERTKTVHALDTTATVISITCHWLVPGTKINLHASAEWINLSRLRLRLSGGLGVVHRTVF
jgi:hypothetical protein